MARNRLAVLPGLWIYATRLITSAKQINFVGKVPCTQYGKGENVLYIFRPWVQS